MLREVIDSEIKIQGLQRQEVAIDIGLSNASLSNFLNGKSGMSVPNIERLLKYLNLKVVKVSDYEVGGDGVASDAGKGGNS